MATLDSTQLTLVDLAKRSRNGMLIDIAEQLDKKTPMIQDLPAMEANGRTNHTTTKRLSLPSGTWRQINATVANEASHTIQYEETMGLLESYSQIDDFLVDLARDRARFRYDEDIAFVQGLGQTLSTALLYGNNTTNPATINGFSTRYNALSDENVWGAGGTGSDLTSIWIVQPGYDKVHLIYPQGSQMGLAAQDDGLLSISDSTGTRKVWQTHFKARLGVVVRDDTAIQRICNIETSGSSNIFDEDLIIKALRKMPDGGQGAIIYMNDTLLAQLDIVAKDKTNVQYSPDAPFGSPQVRLLGKPVKQLDSLLNTETAIS